MKKNLLLLFITVLLLLSNVNCFASDTQYQQYQYTKQELQQGREKAQKIWFTLDLKYIHIGNNCLKVGAEKWTEKGQVLFVQTTGIQNVIFETAISEPNHIYIVPIIRNLYTAKIDEDNRILVEHEYGIINQEQMYDVVTFQQTPYLKNDSIMIPLKEMLDIENQNRGLSDETVYTLQPEQCTIKCNENEIIFYNDKRNVIVNGIPMGLYEIPDITQNDVFVSAQDLKMILEDSVPYFKKETKKVTWNIDMMPPKNKGISIQHTISKITPITITVYRNEDESISFNNITSKNTISTYTKNDTTMIAVKDLDYIDRCKVKFDTQWNGQNNTLTLKTWYTMPKDIIFTKDSNKMLVNGIEVTMQENAEIKDNYFYIPITALFQILEVSQQNIIYS